MKLFNPGKRFPAISLSGGECELNCAHCSGQYINNMVPAISPNKLIVYCEALESRGALGALISGGCDINGQVILEPYLHALKQIKQNTNLVLNIHTGLVTQEQSRQLAKTGIDFVSLEIIGSSETIKKVYGLNNIPEDYRRSLIALRSANVPEIVPHICIGLDFGKIKGEFNAIDMLVGMDIGTLVFIVLIPTKGTKMEQCKPPSIEEVTEIIKYARANSAMKNIYLGCMRPKSKEFRDYGKALELSAISAGINGLVLPSKSTLRAIQEQGIQIEWFDTCCSVK